MSRVPVLFQELKFAREALENATSSFSASPSSPDLEVKLSSGSVRTPEKLLLEGRDTSVGISSGLNMEKAELLLDEARKKFGNVDFRDHFAQLESLVRAVKRLERCSKRFPADAVKLIEEISDRDRSLPSDKREDVEEDVVGGLVYREQLLAFVRVTGMNVREFEELHSVLTSCSLKFPSHNELLHSFETVAAFLAKCRKVGSSLRLSLC